MNFKKCTSFIMAFVLLVSNAGFALNVHYCGGEIASVSSIIFDSGEICKPAVPVTKSCCAKKIFETKKKCCSDKVVDFKGKSHEVVVKVFSVDITAPLAVPVFRSLVFTPASISKRQQIADYFFHSHAPPLFKRYCQYILYA